MEEERKEEQQEDIVFTKELDMEAIDVIFRLYDKTFKELVDR